MALLTSKHNSLRVSVVMCTYNGAAFVAEQLHSILLQTYPLKEVLIFDDASTDETVSIIRAIAREHSTIHVYVNKSNIGFTRNFEQAMRAATGDAIAIADHDDVWVVTKIEDMIEAWVPDVPLIYCASNRFKDVLPLEAQPHPAYRRYEGTDARKLFMFNTVSGHSLLIKRWFLRMVVPFPEKVMYDWWMAVVASYNGGVQYVPKVLVHQRVHQNNASIQHQDRHNRRQLKMLYKRVIIDNCLQFATAPGIPAKHKELALRMAELNKESLSHKFYRPLFLFNMSHRKLFFNYKVRKIGWISHIKHSYRRTVN